MLRAFKEHLGQLVVLLNERLIVYLGQKRSFLFVLGRSGGKVLVGFQVKSLLVSQHIVPDVAAAAEGLLEQLGLGLVGIKASLGGGILNRYARPCRRFLIFAAWQSAHFGIKYKN